MKLSVLANLYGAKPLDEALKKRAAAAIKAANKDGLTIVISHDKEAAKLLDAKVLLVEGTPVTVLKSL